MGTLINYILRNWSLAAKYLSASGAYTYNLPAAVIDDTHGLLHLQIQNTFNICFEDQLLII
jgi:hypothetical protein